MEMKNGMLSKKKYQILAAMFSAYKKQKKKLVIDWCFGGTDNCLEK